MVDPVAITALTTASAKGLEAIVLELYQATKSSVKLMVRKAIITSRITKLHDQINSVAFVKTLWQLDNAVDLHEFYCDSHVLVRVSPKRKAGKSQNVRRKVISVDSLSRTASVVVQGIAGQGKSILLRYLCCKELAQCRRIPIFVELHKIEKDECLLDHIHRAISVLGFPSLDDKLFTKLCKTGKLIFFLDGFDEVKESKRTAVINEIEYLDSLGPSQFVISSRPDSGIEMSPRLKVIKLDDLRGQEYKRIIRKLSESEKFAKDLIKQVEKHIGQLRELLCTPLLVTLLIMSYKSYQELPTQLSDFYERIFQDLLQRHDGTKPGFRRKRRTPLSDVEYRTAFDCFCYRAKAIASRSLKYAALCGLARTALEKSGFKVQPESYLEDIIRVTCLILKEGQECRFIHNSVQEYYAASYVRTRPDLVAKKFYDHCITRRARHRWGQELLFLSEIDAYRYNKYFLLPYHCAVFGGLPAKIPKSTPRATLQRTRDLLGDIKITFGNTPKHENLRPVMFSWHITRPDRRHIHTLFNLDYAEAIRLAQLGQMQRVKRKNRIWPAPYTMLFVITIKELLKKGVMRREFRGIAQTIITDAYETAKKAKSFVEREENCDLELPDI